MGIEVPNELNDAAGTYVLAFGARVLAVVDRSRRAAVMVPEPETIRAGCAWREFRWALGHVRFEVTVA